MKICSFERLGTLSRLALCSTYIGICIGVPLLGKVLVEVFNLMAKGLSGMKLSCSSLLFFSFYV